MMDLGRLADSLCNPVTPKGIAPADAESLVVAFNADEQCDPEGERWTYDHIPVADAGAEKCGEFGELRVIRTFDADGEFLGYL